MDRRPIDPLTEVDDRSARGLVVAFAICARVLIPIVAAAAFPSVSTFGVARQALGVLP
jgi:hypothetical protein